MLISLALENTAGAHSGTNAHGNDASLGLRPLHLVEKSNDHASAGHTQRVAESDGAAAPVELLSGNLERVYRVRGLGSEGFVDLKNVNVFDRQTALLEGGRDRERRTDAHDFWRHAGSCKREEAANDRKPVLFSVGALGQEDDSGAVGDLRRISRSGGATLLEGWFELRQALQSRLRPDAVIAVDKHLLLFALFIGDNSFVRRDLLLGPTLFLRVCRLHVTLVRHFVLCLARNSVFLSDVLGSDAHGYEDFLGFIVLKNSLGHFLRVRVILLHAVEGHAFDATTNPNVYLARSDLIGHGGDGLQARRTQSVYGGHRDRVRDSSEELGRTSGGLSASRLQHVANADFAEGRGIRNLCFL